LAKAASLTDVTTSDPTTTDPDGNLATTPIACRLVGKSRASKAQDRKSSRHILIFACAGADKSDKSTPRASRTKAREIETRG